MRFSLPWLFFIFLPSPDHRIAPQLRRLIPIYKLTSHGKSKLAFDACKKIKIKIKQSFSPMPPTFTPAPYHYIIIIFPAFLTLCLVGIFTCPCLRPRPIFPSNSKLHHRNGIYTHSIHYLDGRLWRLAPLSMSCKWYNAMTRAHTLYNASHDAMRYAGIIAILLGLQSNIPNNSSCFPLVIVAQNVLPYLLTWQLDPPLPYGGVVKPDHRTMLRVT